MQDFFNSVRPISAAFLRLFPLFLANKWRTVSVAKYTDMGIINISKKKSRDGKLTWYYFEWGKGTEERKASGIFIYNRPIGNIQKDFNREAKALLETKRSQLIIERQSIGTPYIPSHKFKDNFLDYYSEFVENNKRPGNRHLQGSYEQLKKFIKKTRLQPLDITENFSRRFRTYLLDHFTGKTPSDYFGAYKRVIKSAFKDGYFRVNPAEDIKSKKNPSKKLREFLEADEYIQLINTGIINQTFSKRDQLRNTNAAVITRLDLQDLTRNENIAF